jgi:uncharacterized protein (TIGR02001 family)
MRAGLPRMNGARLSGPTRLLLGSVLILQAAPACAEVGATVTLASQDRFRGYSVSDGYPAATFSLSYDDAAGPYVEGSIMIAGNPSDGIERSRFEGNAGYAVRLKNGPTLDAGIVHAEYTGYHIYGRQAVFTEIYAGLIAGHVSAHVHYSPNYFQRGVRTFYADVDGSAPLAPRLRLSAHYGMLFQIDGNHEPAGSHMRDWRIGASTDVKRLTFELALASGANRRGFYGAVRHGGTALLFSATAAF